MKLFLDDVRQPPDSSWTVVRTAEEAAWHLATGVVEELSLDHDLGACTVCAEADLLAESCRHARTGYDLCCWMEWTGLWPKQKPVIHSMNPVGRQRMAVVLEKWVATAPLDDADE